MSQNFTDNQMKIPPSATQDKSSAKPKTARIDITDVQNPASVRTSPLNNTDLNSAEVAGSTNPKLAKVASSTNPKSTKSVEATSLKSNSSSDVDDFRFSSVLKMSKEQKEQKYQKAFEIASHPEVEGPKSHHKKIHRRRNSSPKLGFGRIVLALGCAGVLVFAIAYFVESSSPDFSLQVAALQTGIEASYPNYVPRGYSLSDITSEEGKVVLSFTDSSTGDSFTLTEESSSWDSSALYSNYVEENFDEDYTTIKEQGLTIYMSGGDIVWVNNGVFYNIKIKTGSLTKKQIRSIAVSL